MKLSSYIIIITINFFLFGCGTAQLASETASQEQPVVIANEALEYQIIILDQGFNFYLNSVAKPEGFYSQNYLENKNNFYVSIWNSRVITPLTNNPSIYENIIDYNSGVDYGYDVNYKLFNYFEFAQRKYSMRLR